MTIMQMYELCQIEVPQAGQTLILEFINEKIKEFAHRTEIYKKSDTITIVANTVEYTLATESTDIDGNKIIRIEFKDSDGEFVVSTYQLKYDINETKIRFYDYLGCPITGIPSEVATIQYEYIAVPPTKIITDTLTEINSQFHEGIRSGVMSKLYRLYPTIQKVLSDGSTAMMKDISMIQLTTKEFEDAVHKGMRFANSSPSIPKEIYTPSY